MFARAGWGGSPEDLLQYDELDYSTGIGLTTDFSLLNMEYLEISFSGGIGYRFRGSPDDPEGQYFPWMRISSRQIN